MLKKKILGVMLILSVAIMLCSNLNLVPLARSDTSEEELVIHRYLDKTGTNFELKNSEYLNVTVASTVTVHMILSAPIEMIDYFVESTSEENSTVLTLGNLNPSTTYYMYQDGYMNEVIFTTSEDGTYTYTQDLCQAHSIFVQPRSSTIYIYENTTLTHDIYGSVVMVANNIFLDLNGYHIIGTDTGAGVDFYGTNSVVKNGTIEKFTTGVWPGDGNTVNCTTIRDCNIGIDAFIGGRNYNTICNNNITGSWMHGLIMWGTVGNNVYGNTFSKNEDDGIFVAFSEGGNKIYHNNFLYNSPEQAESWWPYGVDAWDDGYPSGGNYWCNYNGVDHYGGPSQNVAGSDGIGDTKYPIETMAAPLYDNYPLMSRWTQAASVKEVEVTVGKKTYDVQLVSNSTITNIDVSPNANILRFDVSGPTGALAYVASALPIGLNSSDIKVFLNGKQLKPPPYPIITKNSMYYFVYFAVKFASTCEVAIVFAPVPAVTDEKPETLNGGSQGNYVTVYIELPEGYSVGDIDISTIKLNGTVAVDSNGPTQIGDYDGDGVPDLMVKFDRAKVVSYILARVDMDRLFEEKFLTVTLMFSGKLYDGTEFAGSDTARIMLPNSISKGWPA